MLMQREQARQVRLYSLVTLIFLLVAYTTAPADEPDSSRSRRRDIHLGRLAYVGIGACGIHWLGYRYLESNWWDGQGSSRFRFVHDWSGDSLLNLDHFGHIISGIFLARTARDVYSWIGFRRKTAVLLGSLTSMAELLYIEYRDGRTDRWGFSVPDVTADAIGALVPLIHEYIPASQAVRFKYSYIPSSLYRDRKTRQTNGRPFVNSFLDDYEGMTFWMVLNPKPFFRGTAAEIWPDWLGVAVGLGAQGLHGYSQKSRGPDRGYPELPEAKREVFLAVDFDFAHFFRNSESLRKFAPYIRLRRFPAPALRIHPTTAFYLFFF